MKNLFCNFKNGKVIPKPIYSELTIGDCILCDLSRLKLPNEKRIDPAVSKAMKIKLLRRWGAIDKLKIDTRIAHSI